MHHFVVFVRAGNIWKISLPFSQFGCEPKTAQKNCLKKKKCWVYGHKCTFLKRQATALIRDFKGSLKDGKQLQYS